MTFQPLIVLLVSNAIVAAATLAAARATVLPETPAEARDVLTFEVPPAPELDLAGYAPGTIVVKTSQRRLYLVLADGEKLSYPVGVGKAGKSWSGTGFIRGKFLRPAWSPPISPVWGRRATTGTR